MPTLADISALRLKRDQQHALEESLAVELQSVTLQQAKFTQAGDQLGAAAEQEKQEQLHAELTQARRDYTKINADLENLRISVFDFSRRTPEQMVEGMDAGIPVALLPIRIETRFLPVDSSPTALWIRIFPDAIHVSGHEPKLTTEESEYAAYYWRELKTAGKNKDLCDAVWLRLAEQVGENRADWLIVSTQALAKDGQTPSALDIIKHTGIKPDDWSAATSIKALPERFLAIGYKAGAEVFREWGALVSERILAGFDPDLSLKEGADSLASEADRQDDLEMGEDLAWATNLAEAKRVGLAIEVTIEPEFAEGLDRLIVLGTRWGETAEEGCQTMQQLLHAHRYDEGFEFLSTGTPTNNSRAGRSGMGAALNSNLAARTQSQLSQRSAGKRFAGALGLASEELKYISGAERENHSDSLHRALWSVTLGYHLEQLLSGSMQRKTQQSLRTHVQHHLSARGSLPTMRIAQQPYGILPITLLKRLSPDDEPEFQQSLAGLLTLFRGFWSSAAQNLPRVGGSDNAGEDLLKILGISASTQTITARPVVGAQTNSNLKKGFRQGVVSTAEEQLQYGLAKMILNGVGVRDELRIARTINLAQQAPVSIPLVSNTLSETEKLTDNYIADLSARLGGGRKTKFVPLKKQASLLGRMLEKSVEQALTSGALVLAKDRGIFAFDRLAEAELIDIELQATRTGKGTLTAQRVLAKKMPKNLEGAGKTLEELVLVSSNIKYKGEWSTVRSALNHLKELPSAELDRLFRESLDVFSYRYDAWVSSLASRKLQALRKKQAEGLYIGAYGFVENLRPAPRATKSKSASIKAEQVMSDPSNAGYVMAPSLSHAATSAVLRAGFLANGGAAKKPFAINLSSKRTRLALDLIEGMRAGRSLAELLGYRLERLLQNAGHYELIDVLRKHFPLNLELEKNSNTESQDAQAAEDDRLMSGRVVDGLRLVRLHMKNGLSLLLQEAGSATLVDALNDITDAFDALSDLATAESVHQAVMGNAERGAAVLQAFDKGDVMPPDPMIARTPRSGIGLTHRLAVFLPSDAQSAWHDMPNLRRIAEPRIDAWFESMLGSPKRYIFSVHTFIDKEHSKEISIPLTELIEHGSSASDIVYGLLAGSSAHGSEFAHRIALLAAKHLEVEQLLRIEIRDAAPKSASQSSLGFAALKFLCAELRRLLDKTRPMTGVDLSPPEAPNAGAVHLQELKQRIERLMQQLNDYAKQISQGLEQGADVRFIIEQVFALGLVDNDLLDSNAEQSIKQTATDLINHIEQLNHTLTTRLQHIEKEPNAHLQSLVDSLKQVFLNKINIVPLVLADNAASLDLSLKSAQLPKAGSAELQDWLLRAALTRDGADRLQRILSAQSALHIAGADKNQLIAVQMPFNAEDAWLGGDLNNAAMPSASASLVALNFNNTGFSDGIAALMIDEWGEVIPAESETAALAFHHNSSNTEAPNALLLAVHPGDKEHWDVDTLEAIINESLNLAKIRAVDLESLKWIARLIPALYLPTVSERTGDAFTYDELVGKEFH
ncbi:MAG: hypothetical protein GQ582_00270 [Methyloprofundus sp.]|nr:hypothetical protein [Methyloprofundus sp.]